MTRDRAKDIKTEFVNMSQNYNGYEITSMWNMMVDQLFDELELESRDPIKWAIIERGLRHTVTFAEPPMPTPRPIMNSVPGVDPRMDFIKLKGPNWPRKAMYYKLDEKDVGPCDG